MKAARAPKPAGGGRWQSRWLEAGPGSSWQGQQLGEFGLGQPPQSLDEGALKIADMGGRPAKADTSSHRN